MGSDAVLVGIEVTCPYIAMISLGYADIRQCGIDFIPLQLAIHLILLAYLVL